ncbi:MAG: DNA translocase FtsK 4TM domain-containing protein, partial [Pseudomonadota bacterium]
MALFWGENTGDETARRRREPPVAGEAPEDLAPETAGLLTSFAARLTGVGALVIGLALLGALISYDADDPSFLMATGKSPTNWLGAP